MQEVVIDKTSPVPLYHQLRGALEKLINNGKYKPGEHIPGEIELCELYGVSRTVVRQTIDEMLKDGILVRNQPRERPTVAQVVLRQNLLSLEGFFTQSMLMSGLKSTTNVLSCELGTFKKIAKKLSLKPDVPFYRIERLHSGDGEPLVLQCSYIPAHLCPDLDKKDLSGWLFTYFKEDYGKKIVKTHQVIRVEQSKNKERVHMKLPQQIPMFQVERISYIEDGQPIEYWECSLRGDRYQFEMNINWDDNKPSDLPFKLEDH